MSFRHTDVSERVRTEAMAMAQDVSVRIAADDRLQMWAHVLEHSAAGIFICNAEERILLVNKAFERLTGFSAQEAIGNTPRILSSGRQEPKFYADLWRSLASSGSWQGEIENRRKDGQLYTEWLSISAVYDAGAKVSHYVGIFSDVTERNAAAARVAHLAEYDALTDLPNRVLLTDRLVQAVKTAERNQTRVAGIFVDLDRFKAINDSLGHERGDELLQIVAKRLSEAVRAQDTVARMGGDEFVVLLPQLNRAKNANLVARKLLAALVRPMNLAGHEIAITASLGISVYPDDAATAQELLRNADAAMYAAKAAGRNAFRFFTADMNRRALEAVSIESALRRALEQNEFELHYQPQIDLTTGALVGAEALIRWRHPERGVLPPGVFLSIAEERGLITSIGEWVVEAAARQLDQWSHTSLRDLCIAVNLSPIQFHQKDFVERLAKALQAHAIDPRRLELELTENIIMQGADENIGVLRRLHDMGLGLAIDDFGTGYCSFNYLRRFPIDKFKIDQSFVREMAQDPDTARIVNGIIGLAKSLKLKVIAEGVETSQQRELLRAQGCDEAQGFLYSQAMPPAAFEDFARRWSEH